MPIIPIFFARLSVPLLLGIQTVGNSVLVHDDLHACLPRRPQFDREVLTHRPFGFAIEQGKAITSLIG